MKLSEVYEFSEPLIDKVRIKLDRITTDIDYLEAIVGQTGNVRHLIGVIERFRSMLKENPEDDRLKQIMKEVKDFHKEVKANLNTARNK